MKAVDIPDRFPIPFASSAGGPYIRPIPEASQIGIEDGAASLFTGFPPLNFTPRSAGGVPPFGADTNGLFNQITQWTQWQNAGSPVTYDGSFASSISGYPRGAVVMSSEVAGLFWLCTADDNETDPDDAATSADWVQYGRIKLGANATFYVSTTGSDITGIGTVGSPWLTMQYAVDTVAQRYDLNGFGVVIQASAGTYTAGAIAGAAFVGAASATPVEIRGDTTTPSNVKVTATDNCFYASGGAGLYIHGIQVKSTNPSSIALGTGSGGRLQYQDIIFDTAGLAHVDAANAGYILALGNNTIVGAAAIHAIATQAGEISLNSSAIIINTAALAFSTAFVQADHLGVLLAASCNITGTGVASLTGKRYNATFNGVIDSNTGSITFFPGNVAGTTATGGQYN